MPPDRHYMLSPQQRLPEACGLVEQGYHSVVHMPRPTGKTTALMALSATGRYTALLFSGETAEPAGDDYGARGRWCFDRREGQPPPYERTRFDTERTPSGRQVTLLRA